MNYTEMEAKVREATNNEPWYAVIARLHLLPAPVANLPVQGGIFYHHAGHRQRYLQLLYPFRNHAHDLQAFHGKVG